MSNVGKPSFSSRTTFSKNALKLAVAHVPDTTFTVGLLSNSASFTPPKQLHSGLAKELPGSKQSTPYSSSVDAEIHHTGPRQNENGRRALCGCNHACNLWHVEHPLAYEPIAYGQQGWRAHPRQVFFGFNELRCVGRYATLGVSFLKRLDLFSSQQELRNITKLTPIQQCPCHSDVSQLGSGAGQSGAQA